MDHLQSDIQSTSIFPLSGRGLLSVILALASFENEYREKNSWNQGYFSHFHIGVNSGDKILVAKFPGDLQWGRDEPYKRRKIQRKALRSIWNFGENFML